MVPRILTDNLARYKKKAARISGPPFFLIEVLGLLVNSLALLLS